MALAKYYNRLIAGVDSETVRKLEQASVLRTLEPHSYLFDQYSEARGVYVLEKGVIMIERSSAAGRRQILGFSYPGDFVGLTHNDFFEYSVQSLTQATVREFSMREFMRFSDASPALKSNVNRIGGGVFSHAIDQVFALGQKKAHERVCYLLQEIRNRDVGPDEHTVELPMTRQDIADYLGLTMETVSRAIRRLRNDGIIEIESSQTIKLVEPEVVSRLGSVTGD
ncbi:MAG: helix-turn-helix domain-containing protein [Gammaproteobacteria bacterium]|nr:helix-turn-helix domain-containing protein [Gammaproteobacteria bacterium]